MAPSAVKSSWPPCGHAATTSAAVRSWLASLGPAVAADDWPLVSDVFRSVHPQDVNVAQAVWRSFREFAVAAGYDARPAAERDFGSSIRSVGSSAAWSRCMMRCNPGRLLLVPLPAVQLPFVAGGEEYANLDEWHSRLRHRPAVPFGHSLALVNFGGVGPLLALSPVGPATAPADLALEAARRSRGELVSTRRAGHGAILLPVRSGIGLAPARAPLPPAMALRCATPSLLPYEYPPVIHQQQSVLQAFPWHPIQGTAYVMMTAAIVSGLLRAYRETERVFEPSPCHYALTKAFSADNLASGDCSAAEALAEYDAIARAVPWAAAQEGLPYHPDPTRQAPSTLLSHQVGTVADRRRHNVRIVGVPRSPHAPLGVMLAEPRLAAAVLRSLPVTEEAWAVPASFPLSDPGDVPPSTEEVVASAAYHARKRRHDDMERGGPAQPGVANPGSPVGATPDVPVGPAAFPASGGRWNEERHDDYPGMAGAEFGDGWPAAAVDGAGGACRNPGDRMEGGEGRGAGVWDDRVWPAASQGDSRSRAAAGRDDPMGRADGGHGRGRDAHAGRHWDAAPKHDGGGYPTGGAGAAAGSQRDPLAGRHWDAGSRRDSGGYPPTSAGAAAGSHRDAHDGRHWDAEPRCYGGGYPAGGAGAAAGSHRDAPASRHWDAEPQRDGGGYPTGGAAAASGSQRDAPAGSHWDAEPRRDGGGYPTACAGADAGSHRDVRDGRHWGSESRRDGGEYNADAAGTGTGGRRSARWDAGPDNNSPPAALLELGIVGPVVTPVLGQPDVAYDWWLSSLWQPPAPMTATAWRDSLTSGKVVSLFGDDGAVNCGGVGPPELTAALLEYARLGLAGVVTPCLETPRTRAKRFHAALRRVLRGAGRPVHVWENRGRD